MSTTTRQKEAIICIRCPLACNIFVKIENNEVTEISGAKCKKGKEYAIEECKEPKRALTATVRTTNKEKPLLPVKTDGLIPKELIKRSMKYLSQKIISSPFNVGDVVIKNILNTGINIIATGNLEYINQKKL